MANNQVSEKEATELAEAYQVSTRTIRKWQVEIGAGVRNPEAVAAMLLSHRRAKTETLEAVNQKLHHSSTL